ncbi:TadE family type IV pilus minor pilin [Paraoerskovia marina]|uniref:TadE family type IV pilus minor pilin n=1 Tax=Paraoerskovia marina TaxID=545619 RepID=UPI00049254B4|nr:TadE family type IV pilus minor pilin [Paraoerskovia marina]
MARTAADRPAGQCGSVTAEFAIALPALVVLLVAVLTLAASATAQMRCVDAARVAARAIALGDDEASVREAVRSTAGDGAELAVVPGEDWITVEVSAPVVGGWFAGAPLRASGSAVARSEP